MPPPSYPLFEFPSYAKVNSQKIPQELLVLWKFFVPSFIARHIWVCYTHLLLPRFGAQLPNMMYIKMVESSSLCSWNFCSESSQTLLSLVPYRAQWKKTFFLQFKRYNLTICLINFHQKICTCSPRSLG
jgi:hypothetical protein